MIKFEEEAEEDREVNVVKIIATDTIDSSGTPAVDLDILFNGLSVGDGDIEYEEIFKAYIKEGSPKSIPPTVLFLQALAQGFLGKL